MPTDDFFRARIDQMIDLSHSLAVLARHMPWESLEKALAPAFAHKGASTACDSPDGIAPVSEACLRPE